MIGILLDSLDSLENCVLYISLYIPIKQYTTTESNSSYPAVQPIGGPFLLSIVIKTIKHPIN